MKPLPYQKGHVGNIAASVAHHRVATDASAPGTGKTYVACAVAARLQCPVAIVSTRATLPNWAAVAQGFGLSPLLLANYEKIRTGRLPECRKASGRFVWNLPQNCLVIFGECQRYKGHTSLNAPLLIAARRQHLRVLLCSATAADNPLGMRAIGYALGLHTLADFWQWAQRYGVAVGVFGMEYTGGEDCLRELHRQIFPAKGSRLHVSDIPDFPDSLVEPAIIDTGKARAIQKEDDALHRELMMAERRRDKKRLKALAERLEATPPSSLTLILRARQAIELYKMAAMAELAEDALAEGASVVLMVNFSESIQALSSWLQCRHLIIGGQSEAERQDIIERFQRNEIHIVIANIKAGGVGLSLHDPQGLRPRLSIISHTFSTTDLRQALGHVHRCGGASSIRKICFAVGTCEEKAAAACVCPHLNADETEHFICAQLSLLRNHPDFVAAVISRMPDSPGGHVSDCLFHIDKLLSCASPDEMEHIHGSGQFRSPAALASQPGISRSVISDLLSMLNLPPSEMKAILFETK